MEIPISVVLFIVNGVMGVFMWFMKSTLNDLKEQDKELRQEINRMKETSFTKQDFSEFKFDLYGRLDELKKDVFRALDKE